MSLRAGPRRGGAHFRRHGRRIESGDGELLGGHTLARVLIVDDTEIVRKALERAITKMGHSAVSTSDSLEALELAVKDPFDLALLDFRMPRMGGAELYQELRAFLGERCPRVVFVTASPAEEVRRGVERIGPPSGYVKKPFHLDELARTVREALAGTTPG